MKRYKLFFVIGLFASFTTTNFAGPTGVAPRVIESELGAALGFQAYCFEAQLADDEALVVHERVVIGTRNIEAEYAAVGTAGKASYDLVLVDSGCFHPSLRNTYMLRFPTSASSVDNVILTGSSHGPDGIEFIFSDPKSFQVKITRRWCAAIEKYEEVRKRWPELPAPRSGVVSGSRRLIADSAPNPADPAAATPVSISRTSVVTGRGGERKPGAIGTTAMSRTVPIADSNLAGLQVDAANDNVAAQVALGTAYYTGQGVARDLSEASRWWRRAAELGDASSQCNLGAMYANGIGVDQSWDLARAWYLKAATQGDARAQSNLAANYANGRGGPVDMTQAFFWAKKAADQGFPASECDLGVMYEAGKGVSRDAAQAIVWYRRAAAHGDARAQAALSRLGEMSSNPR